MRFLIVAAAVFACAAAAPSGALLAAPYSGLIAPWAPLGPLAVGPVVARTVALPAAVPTIPPGDVQGAVIDANTAAVDAVRAVSDQAAELQGRAINAAEGNAWQAISDVQTAQAQVDGAAAAVAPIAAKSLVAPVAPVAYAAPVAPVAYAGPGLIAPAVAPLAPVLAARALAPTVIAGSQSISTQSLSQTHPSPAIISPLSYAHAW